MKQSYQLLLIIILLLYTLVCSNDMITSLFNQANTYYNQGLYDQAKHYYKEILRHNPNNADVLCNLASLLMDMNDVNNAEINYRKTLNVDENHSSALYNLASLLQDRNSNNNNDINEAKELYQKLLIMEPNSIDALANLGSLYHRTGDYLSAIKCYEDAINIIKANNNDDNNAVLSSLYEHYGRAIIRIADTKKLAQNNTNNNDNDSKVIDSLLIEAQQLLNNSLHYNNNNTIAKHMLMSILSDNCTNNDNDYQASDDYITRLFDDFSSSFETSLEKLEYHAPSLLTKAIVALNQSSYSVLVDLGCGTGLLGAMLANVSTIDYIIGVDLSKKMLQLAADKKVNNKRVYGNLFAGPMTLLISSLAKYRSSDESSNINNYDSDIIDVEDIVTNGFDKKFINGSKQLHQLPMLIVAADVFVYVGDLEQIIESFRELKMENDVFAFTTEALPEDDANTKGYKLQASGRYAHKKSYIDKLLNDKNFSLITYEAVTLRKELGTSVYGHLYLFK